MDTAQGCVKAKGGGGAGPLKFVYHKWPNPIFTTAHFVFLAMSTLVWGEGGVLLAAKPNEGRTRLPAPQPAAEGRWAGGGMGRWQRVP